MPIFVMIGHDGPDGARRRDAHRQRHVDHLNRLDGEGRIVFAGPIRNEANDASVGAVIVFEASDLNEAREIVDRDPFVSGGVFERLTVAPFKQVLPKPP
jgi:uncharacterized protein YciI